MAIIISIVVFAIAGEAVSLLWSVHKSKDVPEISQVDVGAQSPQLAATEADEAQEDGSELESTDKDYSQVGDRRPRTTGVFLQPLS